MMGMMSVLMVMHCHQLLIVCLLRLHDALQTLLTEGMDDTAIFQALSLDLTLHPDNKTSVHPDIVILCAAHVICQLQFRRSAMDMRFGERNDIAGRSSGGLK
jgi:hypothetical protein